ncbi:MAG: SAM-dependent methyltransferase [Chloroflexi bacterium]|nr:SAM-dependent methyltransferase [Chloroflexota bacterium]
MNESLESRIGAIIERDGPISFARFMELALYDQERGYYSSPPTGQDYYTSPFTHPVFGALVAIQLEQVWSALGHPGDFPVVEMGAGNGVLAADVLDYAPQVSPGFASALRYTLIDKHRGQLPPQPIEGCFISNELVDALPTHVVAQTGGRLREVMVGVEGGRFVEVLGEPLTEVAELLAEELSAAGLGTALPEGYRTEVNVEAPRWMASVAQALQRGAVITIDYGYVARELYSPQRKRGTLMCYYQHTYNEDPLSRVGRQDITSHVDFTSLIRAGEKSGLRSEGLVTQQEFLTNLGIRDFMQALASLDLPPSEYWANLYALRDLVRPEGIGSFGVLLQSRALEGIEFMGLHGPADTRYVAPPRVPRLRPEHLPLYQAKYPLVGEEFQLWQLT